ncbi:MAG: family 20 glycosylhydrolase [candidate division KSB1 bacterium]|nr:family 20 glycosylhydrolase [candidate division KSB1 bacterium]MDZ7276522.1 family 20 glycosylhydrolase [candidate division KSB1 bacterium]MDZ7286697.1 family 20 glycosylhydrolase [candidate division KSB1 bacterium]MDZ7300292.1 family 20 glycosylhydrolase [candidate division KSB1 bacterium]MDZ7307893.1 family 20 glycosylhydrolase [candidate division KSB1 bacterium]
MSLHLLPQPAQLELQPGQFRLHESFTMAVTGRPEARLYRAATRALRRLAGRTGLFLPQNFVRPGWPADSAQLVIHCERPGQVRLGEDESYTLTVTPEKIHLHANTDIGGLRGLETLLQLLAADEQGYFFPAVKIVDRPRFPWRGLLIDACRHFMPVEVILRNLDGMAAVKLNVLHWHLSEDQGFRVESKVYPKLHELGSDGFYYTQAQIREVIAYAAERGIRVVPEFDVPGHSTSWLVAYPELGSAPGPYQIERDWGIFPAVLNPAREFTYQFLDKFFGEMAVLFPDPYFHIGGDEIEHGGRQATHWNDNPEIRAFKQKHNLPDNAALQAHFNRRVLQILTRHGKIMVGWDEILHPDMPNNIVIQSWRGREAMIKAAQQGYQSILSNGYYIDLIQPTDFHYSNDPLPADSPLNEQERSRILGGEATMWSEMVSPETIDSRIWPRTAAIAERLWSPGMVKDVDDMYRRLAVISRQLEEHGLTHEKNYDMMLRRLAGRDNITALKNLVDVIEPVKFYNRNRLRRQNSFSPLTRVVDAARPDAAVARNFRRLVARYLAGTGRPEEAAEIKSWLVLWRDNHAALLPVIKAAPVLAEIAPLSQDLAEIAGIGLDALGRLESQQSSDEAWQQEKLAILQKAATPRGQTELMVVTAIEQLVQASGNRPR